MSPRAALIYQHATADRDAAIAKALSDLATAQKPEREHPHSGPCGLSRTLRTEMATEPHDPMRRSQPAHLSKEELLRRAKPFEPLPGPLFDDLSDEEEEAFWNAVNE